MKTLTRPLHRAIAAAATLSGRRFGMLVASSLLATSVIVASAITNPDDDGPLAALLGRSLASDNAPAPTSPTPRSLRIRRREAGQRRPPVDRRSASPASAGTPASTPIAGLPRSWRLRRRRIASPSKPSTRRLRPQGRSDQARLRHLARQPRLRSGLWRRLSDALPGDDAPPPRRAALRLLAARQRRPAQRHRGDQRPTAKSLNPGQLLDLHRIPLTTPTPTSRASSRDQDASTQSTR